MPPEETTDQFAPEPTVQETEWGGPWGAIDPVPNSVETLCVRIEPEVGKPRIYYYPYRTIGKWNWSMGAPETLEIQIGGVHLTVSGTGLHRLAEALNSSQLRLIHFNHALLSGNICIRSIVFEDLTS